MKIALKRLFLFLTIGIVLVGPPLNVLGGVNPVQNQSAFPHATKGDEYSQSGQYTLAIQEYQLALSEEADTELVRYNLGLALVMNSQPEKALEEWGYLVAHAEPTLQNTDVLTQTYFNIGVANTKKGSYQAAISALKQAISLGQSRINDSSPFLGNAYFGLGVAYSGLSDWREAADAFEEAKQRQEERPEIYTALSHAYLELNDWINAEKTARKSVELNPADADNHHLLGLAYCAQGKKTLAEGEMTTLYRMGVSPASVQETLHRFCKGIKMKTGKT